MPLSWQTPDQKSFIEDHFASYVQHSEKKTLKTLFWPDFFNKWFKTWPLPEPTSELIEKEKSVEKAAQLDRTRKINVSAFRMLTECFGSDSPSIQQLKRVLRGMADDGALSGRRDLRLEDRRPRKWSEVQVYMSLYYDTRIRPTILK